MVFNIPCVDVEKQTVQRHYQDVVNWINDNIPGQSYAEKERNLMIFYCRNYKKTQVEYIGDEFNILCQEIGEKILNYGRK
jgi:hypothetical protein